MRAAFVLPVIVGLLMIVGCSTQPKDSSTKAEPPVASTNSDSSLSKSEHNSAIPFTASDEASIRDQVERNWNLGELAGSPKVAGMMVELRIELLPDGTVTKAEVANNQSGNSTFRQLAESAIRAVMISSPLKLPPGRNFTVMHLRFHPDQAIQ